MQKLVGWKVGGVLDKGRFQRGNVIAGLHNETGRFLRLACLLGEAFEGEETAASGDNAILATFLADQHGLQDAARLYRRIDVGNVGRFAPVAHIEPGHFHVGDRDMF